MPERAVAVSDIQVVACIDGLSNVVFSVTDGVFHRVSLCQIACNSGGEGTACSVQIVTFYLFLLIYMIDRFGRVQKVAHIVSLQMSAFLLDASVIIVRLHFGGCLHVLNVVNTFTCKHLRFVDVGGD